MLNFKLLVLVGWSNIKARTAALFMEKTNGIRFQIFTNNFTNLEINHFSHFAV